MAHLLGSSVAVFIGVTMALFGAAAWMTGRAVAIAWQSAWLLLPYSLLLGLGARFLTYALFDGELFTWRGYVVSTGVIGLVMLIAYRVYHVRQMVHQYPWLYRRRGPFAWSDRR